MKRHGEILHTYTTTIGKKATKALEDFQLNKDTSEKVHDFFEKYNRNNTRYQKEKHQLINFKAVLIKSQELVLSIQDEQQRKFAQVHLGIIVIDKNYLCIWVERLKQIFGSHSTINNLFKKAGCKNVPDSVELKHSTILAKAPTLMRNWTVRECNGIFDKFFPEQNIEPKTKESHERNQNPRQHDTPREVIVINDDPSSPECEEHEYFSHFSNENPFSISQDEPKYDFIIPDEVF